MTDDTRRYGADTDAHHAIHGEIGPDRIERTDCACGWSGTQADFEAHLEEVTP